MCPKRWLAAASVAGLAVLVTAPGRAQEKKELVYRSVPSAFLEKVLDGLNITYKKTAGQKEGQELWQRWQCCAHLAMDLRPQPVGFGRWWLFQEDGHAQAARGSFHRIQEWPDVFDVIANV